ncbi:SDR family NAD(P)-dependent oxidoreductase [Paenibacillus sp. HJGM_3]|uniref:SDR family NAD(P)-dependent oxidoreductase n=1 Tax=Paenibacillus sp. HJGM_3 TaxID=3379816 RepID=UPI00385845CA
MIEGKVIAITGASSGIGAEIAVELAHRGAVLALFGRNPDGLRTTAARLGSATHRQYVLDVTSDEQVRQAVEQVVADFGRIDVWINNAGFGRFARMLDTPIEDFASMMNANYMGVVRCTKAVLPHMLLARSGQIVNVASIAGKIGSSKATAYAASKHAVLGFTNSLRQELAGTGVMITAVNPGPIDTPFLAKADPSGHYVRNIATYLLKPQQVARAVAGAIERRRSHVDLPWIMGFGAKLFALFPGLFERIAGGLLNKK